MPEGYGVAFGCEGESEVILDILRSMTIPELESLKIRFVLAS